MVTESQAKMDEYIEESRVSQKAIIKEIREEKDNKIEQLKRKDTWKAKAERLIDYNNRKDKEIEQLRKEKDWLLQEAIYEYNSKRNPQPPKGEARENILETMQQALKEG